MPQRTEPPIRPWPDRHLWQIKPVRDLIWIAAVVFFIWFGYELSAIFTPVLVALALAYLFHPIITLAERRWNMPRPATIAVILAVMILGGVGFMAWLAPKFINQLVQFVHDAPRYAQILSDRYNIDVREQVRQFAEEVGKDPRAFLADKAMLLFTGTGHAVDVVGRVLGTTTYIVVTLLLIPLYFFFFAWQFGPLVGYFEQFLPASRRQRILDILGRMDKTVATFFRARVTIAIIMGVLFSVGWWWFGVPYWFLLGMGSGLLSLIPYASAIGWPLAVILKWLAVTSGDDAAGFDMWVVMVWPSVVYIVVQMLEAWVLTPWIQGQSLEMSMVTILIAVFVGGAVGGLYGLLLCIPIVACGKILMVEVVLPRMRTWAAEN
ncbi:MAG: AI-2E family transporter [Planctomycetes bacterium]|nr:AI-2E family transporter [Planctomycetota bacterium]